MATYFWNVFSGLWNDSASWLGAVAPGSGDQGVVAHGTLTNATVEFTGLTVDGQMITVVAANQLSFNGSTLGPETLLTNIDADGLTMSFAGSNAFNGPAYMQSPGSSLYFIPATSAALAIGGDGFIEVTGAAQAMGQGTLTNNGVIRVGTGFAPGGLVVTSPGVGVVNNGSIEVKGVASDPVATTHAVFQAMSGDGTVSATRAEVSFLGAVASGLFRFDDDSAVLQLNVDTAEYNAVIAGFKPGNRIDLGTTQVDSVAYAPDPGGFTGTLTVGFEGAVVATLNLDGFYSGYVFSLSDIGGDKAIGTAPCFVQGTRLATSRGEVAVEALRVGDVMRTRLGGQSARVVWIGWRRVDCRRHPRPQDVMPVRVRRGAFAPGVPRRDVALSPDHAVWLDGVLIPVRRLVNGATILRHEVPAVTYWHVELERHDVMDAAGLPVESYLDTGNRASFSNGPMPRTLHADFARAVWATAGCATLHVEGPVVAAAKARLRARARALGFAAGRDAAVHLSVDGRRVEPLVEGAEWLVPLPRGAQRLRLRSASGVPEEVEAAGCDPRRLGLALAAPCWDGVAARLDDARFLSGWHAPEAEWRWTDGDAELDVRGLADVGFRVVRLAERWRKAA